MTGGEIFLLALGPTIALAAGLIIYGLGSRCPVREGVQHGSRRDP